MLAVKCIVLQLTGWNIISHFLAHVHINANLKFSASCFELSVANAVASKQTNFTLYPSYYESQIVSSWDYLYKDESMNDYRVIVR